jgi:hypothetical protein
MTRAEAQKAVDAAFLETLGGEYRNLLNAVFSEKPTTETTDTAFRKALAMNLAAHKIASRAVAENTDLKD